MVTRTVPPTVRTVSPTYFPPKVPRIPAFTRYIPTAPRRQITILAQKVRTNMDNDYLSPDLVRRYSSSAKFRSSLPDQMPFIGSMANPTWRPFQTHWGFPSGPTQPHSFWDPFQKQWSTITTPRDQSVWEPHPTLPNVHVRVQEGGELRPRTWDDIAIKPYTGPKEMHPSWSSEQAQKIHEANETLEAIVSVMGGQHPVLAGTKLKEVHEALLRGEIPLKKLEELKGLVDAIQNREIKWNKGMKKLTTFGSQSPDISGGQTTVNFSQLEHRDVRLRAMDAAQETIAGYIAETAKRTNQPVEKVAKLLGTPSDQQHAVIVSKANAIMIKGGPGTGKTNTITGWMAERAQRGFDLNEATFVAPTHASIDAMMSKVRDNRALYPDFQENKKNIRTPQALAILLLNQRTVEKEGRFITPLQALGPEYKDARPMGGRPLTSLNNLGEIEKATKSGEEKYVERLLEKYKNTAIKASDLAKDIAETKENRFGGVYQERFDRGQKAYAEEMKNEKALTSPDALFYAYEMNRQHIGGFGLQGQTTPEYDRADSMHYAFQAGNRGLITPLKGLIADEVQGLTPVAVAMLSSITNKDSHVVMGGDMSQQTIYREHDIPGMIGRAFSKNRAFEEHTLTGTYRLSPWNAAAANAATSDPSQDGKPRSPYLVSVGANRNDWNFPENSHADTFHELYNKELDHWFGQMQLSMKQVHANIESGKPALHGSAMPPEQAPFIYMMKDQRNQLADNLQGYLTHHLGSSMGAQAFNQIYSEQIPTPGSGKLHGLMMDQAKGHEYLAPRVNMNRGGLWEAHEYWNQMFTMMTRAKEQVRFISAGQNVSGTKHDQSPDIWNGKKYSHGWLSFIQRVIDNGRQQQGLPFEAIPEQWQHLDSHPLVPNVHTPLPQNSAVIQKLADFTHLALTNNFFQPGVGDMPYIAPVGSVESTYKNEVGEDQAIPYGNVYAMTPAGVAGDTKHNPDTQRVEFARRILQTIAAGGTDMLQDTRWGGKYGKIEKIQELQSQGESRVGIQLDRRHGISQIFQGAIPDVAALLSSKTSPFSSYKDEIELPYLSHMDEGTPIYGAVPNDTYNSKPIKALQAILDPHTLVNSTLIENAGQYSDDIGGSFRPALDDAGGLRDKSVKQRDKIRDIESQIKIRQSIINTYQKQFDYAHSIKRTDRADALFYQVQPVHQQLLALQQEHQQALARNTEIEQSIAMVRSQPGIGSSRVMRTISDTQSTFDEKNKKFEQQVASEVPHSPMDSRGSDGKLRHPGFHFLHRAMTSLLSNPDTHQTWINQPLFSRKKGQPFKNKNVLTRGHIHDFLKETDPRRLQKQMSVLLRNEGLRTQAMELAKQLKEQAGGDLPSGDIERGKQLLMHLVGSQRFREHPKGQELLRSQFDDPKIQRMVNKALLKQKQTNPEIEYRRLMDQAEMAKTQVPAHYSTSSPDINALIATPDYFEAQAKQVLSGKASFYDTHIAHLIASDPDNDLAYQIQAQAGARLVDKAQYDPELLRSILGVHHDLIDSHALSYPEYLQTRSNLLGIGAYQDTLAEDSDTISPSIRMSLDEMARLHLDAPLTENHLGNMGIGVGTSIEGAFQKITEQMGMPAAAERTVGEEGASMGVHQAQSRYAPFTAAFQSYAHAVQRSDGGGILDPHAGVMNGDEFQLLGAPVTPLGYQQRLEEMLGRGGFEEGADPSDHLGSQLLMMKKLRGQLNDPTFQEQAGHLLNIVQRSTMGVPGIDRSITPEERKTGLRNGKPIYNPIDQFFGPQRDQFGQHQRTIEGVTGYMGALHQAMEHMQQTGTLKRGHIDQLLTSMGHTTDHTMFKGLRHMEKMGRFTKPEDTISLDELVHSLYNPDHPKEWANLAAEFTRYPLHAGQQVLGPNGMRGALEAAPKVPYNLIKQGGNIDFARLARLPFGMASNYGTVGKHGLGLLTEKQERLNRASAKRYGIENNFGMPTEPMYLLNGQPVMASEVTPVGEGRFGALHPSSRVVEAGKGSGAIYHLPPQVARSGQMAHAQLIPAIAEQQRVRQVLLQTLMQRSQYLQQKPVPSLVPPVVQHAITRALQGTPRVRETRAQRLARRATRTPVTADAAPASSFKMPIGDDLMILKHIANVKLRSMNDYGPVARVSARKGSILPPDPGVGLMTTSDIYATPSPEDQLRDIGMWNTHGNSARGINPPSSEQLGFITDPAHNKIVEGGPGGGKTETLGRSILHDVTEGTMLPHQAMFLSAMHSGTMAIDKTMAPWQELMPGGEQYQFPSARTFHSLAAQVLFHGSVRDPVTNKNSIPNLHKLGLGHLTGEILAEPNADDLENLSSSERQSALANSPSTHMMNWMAQAGKPISRKDAYKSINAINVFKQQRGRPGDQYEEMIRRGSDQLAHFGPVTKEAQAALYHQGFHARGAMDYNDLMYYASEGFHHLDPSDIPAELLSVRHIAADEAQDVTPQDTHMLGAYRDMLGRLGITPKISISMDRMQSLKQNLGGIHPNEVMEHYKSLLGVSQEHQLTTNFRSDANIVALNNAFHNDPIMAGRAMSPLQVPFRTTIGKDLNFTKRRSQPRLYDAMIHSMLSTAGTSIENIAGNVLGNMHPLEGMSWGEDAPNRPNQVPAILSTKKQQELFSFQAKKLLRDHGLSRKQAGETFHTVFRKNLPGHLATQQDKEQAKTQFPIIRLGSSRSFSYGNPHFDRTIAEGQHGPELEKQQQSIINALISVSRQAAGGQVHVFQATHPFYPDQQDTYMHDPTRLYDNVGESVMLGGKELLADKQNVTEKFEGVDVPGGFASNLKRMRQGIANWQQQGILPSNVVDSTLAKAPPARTTPSSSSNTTGKKESGSVHSVNIQTDQVNVSMPGSGNKVTVNGDTINRGSTPPPPSPLSPHLSAQIEGNADTSHLPAMVSGTPAQSRFGATIYGAGSGGNRSMAAMLGATPPGGQPPQPPQTSFQKFNNDESQLGHSLARIGGELQTLGMLGSQVVDKAIKQGSDYRLASIPVSGGNGTTGFFDFSGFSGDVQSPASTALRLKGIASDHPLNINDYSHNTLPMYSNTRVAQGIQDLTGQTNTSFSTKGTLPALTDIMGLAAMTGIDPQSLMSQMTGITGSVGGSALGQIPQLTGMLSGIYGNNLTDANVSPTLSALSSILPTLQGGNAGGPSQAPQAMAFYKLALKAGMTSNNLGGVSNLMGSLAGMGNTPSLQQQYTLGQLFGNQNLTASPELASFQSTQTSEQQSLAMNRLQQNIGGGLSLPNLQIKISQANIQMQQAQLTMSAAQLQASGVQQQQSQLQQNYSVASFSEQQSIANAQYGKIGQDTSRTAYFSWLRNQNAAAYNGSSPETATQFTPAPTFGLQNAQFYAGIEHQRSQMILGRSPLLSDMAFQENNKYLNQQEAFYQAQLKLTNQQRSFELDWQPKLLAGNQKVLDVNKSLLGVQAQELGVQQQQFALQQEMAVYEQKADAITQKYLAQQGADLANLIGQQQGQLHGLGPVSGKNVTPGQIVQALADKHYTDSALRQNINAMGLPQDQQQTLFLLVKQLQKGGKLSDIEKQLGGKGDKALQANLQALIGNGAFASGQTAAAGANASLNYGGTGAQWSTLITTLGAMNTSMEHLASFLAPSSSLVLSLATIANVIGPLALGLGAISNILGLLKVGSAAGLGNILGNVLGGASGASGAGSGGAGAAAAAGAGSVISAVVIPAAIAVGGVLLAQWLGNTAQKYTSDIAQDPTKRIDVPSWLDWARTGPSKQQVIKNFNQYKATHKGKAPPVQDPNDWSDTAIGHILGWFGIGPDAPKGQPSHNQGFHATNQPKKLPVYGPPVPPQGHGYKATPYVPDKKAADDWKNIWADHVSTFFKKDAPNWIGGMAKGWHDHIGGFFNNLGSGAHDTFSIWGKQINVFFTQTLPNFWNKTVWPWLQNSFGTFFNNLGSGAHDTFTTWGKQITGFFGGIGKTFGDSIGTFFGKTLPDFFTKDLPKTLSDALTGFLKKAQGTGSGILGNIMSLFGAGGGGAGAPVVSHGGFITPNVNADFHRQMAYGIHQGVDFEAAQGTPLEAFDGGTITGSGFYPWGGEIDVDIGGGLTERYLHLSLLGAQVGQKVKRGQRIGLTGGGTPASGLGVWSSGAHSHVQIDRGDINAGVDPWPIWALLGDQNISQYYSGSYTAPTSASSVSARQLLHAGGGLRSTSSERMHHLSEGGVAMKRMRTELAEQGPEAVIPLSKLASVLSSNTGDRTAHNGQSDSKHAAIAKIAERLEIHVHTTAQTLDEQAQDTLMAQLFDIFIKAIDDVNGKAP